MIIQGTLADTNGRRRTQVLIEDGLIREVNQEIGKPDYAFDDSCLIFPGFIDIHVHAREDVSAKQNYKEDFKSAAAAAINGGVCAFVDMPNNPVPPIDKVSYEAKKQLTKEAKIPIYLYAGIGPGTRPFGAPAYKVYMGPSVGKLFFKDGDSLKLTISNYKGERVAFHCEDPRILEEHKTESRHEGQRPEIAEVVGIKNAVKLIRTNNLKGVICHVSTAKGAELLGEHQDITMEIAPHHAFFEIENLKDKRVKMNPPIRSNADREALLVQLRDRDNVCLASDHAPHSLQEKTTENPSGVPMLDTYGPFVSWLIAKGISPVRISQICSYYPGKVLNSFSNKKYGLIEKGYVGSLTVLNMKKPITVTKDKLKTKCRWSPFEGFTFPGSVEATIVGGKLYEP